MSAPPVPPPTNNNNNNNNSEDLKENIWQQLLAKATNKTKEEDSTLIVLGEKKNGKSYLLKKFKDRVYNQKSQEYLLDYSYVNVKNSHEDDETRAYMNIWEVDNPEQAVGILPIVLKPEALKKTVYMITLDLSQPWTIMSSLTKWMEVLKQCHEKIFARLSDTDKEALRHKISVYQQLYVDLSVQTEDRKQQQQPNPNDLRTHPEIPPINLGVPVIIVGCKADSLAQVFTTQIGVGDRFDYINRNLRKYCLEYGASLFFTSSVGQTGTNVSVLQEYLYHRLYQFELLQPSKPVGSETDFAVHVFTGFDSLGTINSIQPSKASWKEDAPFTEVFKNPTVAKAASTQRQHAEVKAEDNEIFLKGLAFNMQQLKQQRNKNKLFATVETAPQRPSISGVSAPPPVASGSSREPSLSVGSTPAPLVPSSVPISSATALKAAAGRGEQNEAVRDFFRSLLNNSDSRGGAAARPQAREALENIRSTQQ